MTGFKCCVECGSAEMTSQDKCPGCGTQYSKCKFCGSDIGTRDSFGHCMACVNGMARTNGD